MLLVKKTLFVAGLVAGCADAKPGQFCELAMSEAASLGLREIGTAPPSIVPLPEGEGHFVAWRTPGGQIHASVLAPSGKTCGPLGTHLVWSGRCPSTTLLSQDQVALVYLDAEDEIQLVQIDTGGEGAIRATAAIGPGPARGCLTSARFGDLLIVMWPHEGALRALAVDLQAPEEQREIREVIRPFNGTSFSLATGEEFAGMVWLDISRETIFFARVETDGQVLGSPISLADGPGLSTPALSLDDEGFQVAFSRASVDGATLIVQRLGPDGLRLDEHVMTRPFAPGALTLASSTVMRTGALLFAEPRPDGMADLWLRYWDRPDVLGPLTSSAHPTEPIALAPSPDGVAAFWTEKQTGALFHRHGPVACGTDIEPISEPPQEISTRNCVSEFGP